MAIQSDTHRDDHLSAALDEALAGETRKGSLLAIAGCFLFFAFQILNSLIDLVTKHQYPAFFRFPIGALVAGIGSPLISVPLYFLAVRSKRPLFWCFVCVALDIFAISELKFFWLVAPPGVDKIPLYLEVRYEDIAVFPMFLAIYSLPLSRRLTLWSTVIMATVWTAGIAYSYSRYADASLYLGPFGPGMGDSGLRALMNPEALSPDFFLIQLVLLGAFAGFVVLAIDQGRQFIVRRVHAEGETALLRRFFPPALAERVATAGTNNLVPARRHVAILFANMPVTSDLASIQDSYRRFEETVFAHGGIVDRFTGGPAMAAFGALGPGKATLSSAVECARALWRTLGAREHTVSLSLHCGDAVCGDAGGAENRTFSIVGDVVNTARRMLDVAITGPGGIVASGAIVAHMSGNASDVSLGVDLGEVKLRGRGAPVHLWRILP